MKFLKTFVRNFVINIDFSPHKTPILGRWALHHDKNADLKAGIQDILRLLKEDKK